MSNSSINCKYLENIRLTVERFPEYRDKMCNIIINEKFNIELPIIVASSFSSSITKIITNDPTTNEFRFSIQSNSQDSLDKIKSVICKREVVSIDNEEDISTFAELGLAIGNDDFINPLKERLEKDSSEMSENNVVQIITSKKTFHIEDIEKEVSFIAEHFETMSTREDFVEFSSKESNTRIVESIISSDKLNMENEDTLLSFLININKSKTLENISTELFDHLFIEYCSPDKCKEFLSFVCDIIHQQNIKSLVSCIGRRFIQPNIPMKPKFVKGRHKEIGTLISNEDPLNGILRREHEKGNVLLEASSTCASNNNGIYNLVKADDNSYFYTKNTPNQYIIASLKDGKTFIVKSYMIRGNIGDDTNTQITNWKLEGQRASDGQWILLDSHNNKSIKHLHVKTFNVSCKEKLKSIKLTQTGKTTNNENYLHINALDIFGYLCE